ncbi:hypothetical protein [Streptomyces phytohabitans]|uniref:hypothetical protein n=1 Tax=Streptomyces phytohabitans TaxID=1150371 RepID=UPI00345BF2AF
MTDSSPTPDDTARNRSRQAVCDAAEELRDALRAAGLRSLSPSFAEDENERPHVQVMPWLSATEAAELARLVRQGMSDRAATAYDLHTALQTHGLKDFPIPTVHGAEIQLGTVTVHTADQLVLILGAPEQETEEDLTEPRQAQQVADRLDAAFQEATGGGFLDTITHPWCARCGAETAIELGNLTIDTAQRFTRALQTEGP